MIKRTSARPGRRTTKAAKKGPRQPKKKGAVSRIANAKLRISKQRKAA